MTIEELHIGQVVEFQTTGKIVQLATNWDSGPKAFLEISYQEPTTQRVTIALVVVPACLVTVPTLVP